MIQYSQRFLNYIKYQTDQIWTKISIAKTFQDPQINSISFTRLLRCKNPTIFQDATLLEFLLLLFFLQVHCVGENNSIRIIFIKFIIKINIFKIYSKNNNFITRKYDISRFFIKVEYIFIYVQSRIKFLLGINSNAARESSIALSHIL